jgi:hypothetical protein
MLQGPQPPPSAGDAGAGNIRYTCGKLVAACCIVLELDLEHGGTLALCLDRPSVAESMAGRVAECVFGPGERVAESGSERESDVHAAAQQGMANLARCWTCNVSTGHGGIVSALCTVRPLMVRLLSAIYIYVVCHG